MNISIADINLWEAVNKVYSGVLGENRPLAPSSPAASFITTF